VVELRNARAVLAALKAEGPPMKYHYGIVYCAWCEEILPSNHGTVDDEEMRTSDHGTMDDGSPCLWVRIEQA
jgi:hypothetical protein